MTCRIVLLLCLLALFLRSACGGTSPERSRLAAKATTAHDPPTLPPIPARCAKESNLDPISLKSCGTGVLGTQLERAAASETAALKPEHTYVPWVVVNTIPLGELDAKLKVINQS